MNNYRMAFKILFFVLLLVSGTTMAQNRHVVSGRVVSPYKGEPIVNAVVTATEMGESVQTDSVGLFSFEVEELKGAIQVWAPGFYRAEQSLSDDTPFSFVLIPENKINYNEYLALPFRSENLKSKASNSNNINQKDFSIGALTVGKAIQNSIPGLQVINKSGMPGEGEVFNSRGVSSFISLSSPLIVVNGMPYLPDFTESRVIGGYSQDVLKMFSNSDIKNITFLRGAEASVYGSLGSNGVLMIETDDAADLETHVEFNAQYGIALNSNTMPVMKGDDYKTYIGNIALTRYPDMADVLDNFPFLKDDPNYFYKYLYNNATDWQDEIYRPAFVTDNSLKIKGGDAIAKYNLSFGYLNHKGVIDNTDLTRYNMKLNSNINVSSKVDLFASMSLAYYTNNVQEQGMREETNPMLAAMGKSPLMHPFSKDASNHILPSYATIRDADGNVLTNNAVTNPVALINQSEIKGQSYDVLMNAGVHYNIKSNWLLTGMFGLYHNYNRENVFIPGLSDRTIMPLVSGLADNTVRMGIGEAFNIYYNVNTRYNYALADDHKIVVTGGLQSILTRREYDSGSGRNTSSDFYKTLDNVNSIGRSFDGYINQWNWMNFFGSASYYYRDLLTAGVNVSIDGSSASGPDATRYGVFPSVNAAFHAKNIHPLREIDFLNKLNVRAEYNMFGNSNFSSNHSEYYYQNQVFRQLSGIVRAGVPNTSLKWENNQTVNLGLDISLFNHRIDVAADFYSSTATDVIIGKQISPVFGSATMYDNLAEIRNNGVEIGLQAYLLNGKDYHWVIGGTLAANKNEIISLGGEGSIITELSDGSALISKEGHSTYSFYGYKTNGIYASSQEASAAGFTDYAGNEFSAGDVRFVNVNSSDAILDPSDRTIIGDANPDLFGRFYTSVGFKGFELTANFIYSYGNEAYNAVRREGESMKEFSNQLVSVNRTWSYEGQVTDMPRAVYGDPRNNSRFSDRWIEDASYIKLKELTLAYNFNKTLFSFIKGGHVYVSGENLITFTDYLGLDPEFAYSYDPSLQGFDLGKIPQPRTFKLGFRLQF